MRSPVPILKLLVVLALVAGITWYRSENNRLRLAGELRARQLEESQGKVSRLQKEVLDQRMRNQGITELVEAVAKKTERQWEEIHDTVASRREPMPEGLRRSLAALNECLREDGYAGMRFTRADAIQAKKLVAAELYVHDPGGLGSDLYLADEVTFSLDRGTGQLTMWFREGSMVKGSRRLVIPPEGHPLVLPQVLGPMWERRLPFLIEAAGDYPPSDREKPRPEPLDLVSRGDWLWRLQQLTEAAKTHVRYRVDRFRGLGNATFKEVLLLGYAKNKRLAESAEVAELQVIVDKRRGTVELLLRDGVLRKTGGNTTIGSDGYRILLLGVTPKQATDSMMGMVVQK